MFVEITRGRSFSGLARYCLHDEGRRRTAERVQFAEVRNLATDNPHVAWRLMVAKHYEQDRLKQEAGVGLGGRKDGRPVGHLILSWKPEEAAAEQLDREKMVRAAEGALRAIGAHDREAIIVAHDDHAHPHLHVVVCLIRDDGRLKPNWKEREKLSKWALERERELHGEPIVKTREENWAARERGETPPPVKKQPRHLFELERAAKSDPELARFAETHRRELARLERAKAELGRRRGRLERSLWERHLGRLRRLEGRHATRLAAARSGVRSSRRPQWKLLLREQEAGRRHFDRNELTLRGRVANTFRLVDWRGMVGRGGGRTAMSEVFSVAGSEGARRQALARRQAREQAALVRSQQRAEKRAGQALGQTLRKRLRLARGAYLRAQRRIAAKLEAERLELKTQQRRLTRERNGAMRASRARLWGLRSGERLTLHAQEKKRRPLKVRKEDRTNPLHLASNTATGEVADAAAVARRADEAKLVIKSKRQRRERKPRGGRAE